MLSDMQQCPLYRRWYMACPYHVAPPTEKAYQYLVCGQCHTFMQWLPRLWLGQEVA